MPWPSKSTAMAIRDRTASAPGCGRSTSTSTELRPGVLFGQSLPREGDGLGEHRSPHAPVDGRDRHPFTEDPARRGERVAVATLDDLAHSLAGQLHDQAAGPVVV